MFTEISPLKRSILVASSYPVDALLLRASADRVGVPITFVEDGVTVMRELCRRPDAYVAAIMSDRVGRVSGLTLSGAARDAGCTLPILLLTADDSAVIAGRAARLCVSVLWQPVSARRLETALRDMVPRRPCALRSRETLTAAG